MCARPTCIKCESSVVCNVNRREFLFVAQMYSGFVWLGHQIQRNSLHNHKNLRQLKIIIDSSSWKMKKNTHTHTNKTTKQKELLLYPNYRSMDQEYVAACYMWCVSSSSSHSLLIQPTQARECAVRTHTHTSNECEDMNQPRTTVSIIICKCKTT